ncbi:Exodeoxyribonuclease 7 small subunit (modular protein) [uncultured delta proteobacterium]|uniref:Exodeoxyribonuclease 7 small subunit n=1 Tax=uncultured delta proteobacterium TaxID=34034 RepID=A0A212J096_9DELT|nr:Exodeoxyribonuclease 7 small subunit (modular protein) [uncultured delta proteobacterium]
MSQKPKFEKQMERLQWIVDELEKGDLALEKSVLLYKEGQILAAACREQLEKARLAVAVRDDSGLSAFPEASGSDMIHDEENDDDA